jgi:hypothetical protein
MDTERLTKKALENLRRNESFRSKENRWAKLNEGEVFEYNPAEMIQIKRRGEVNA